MLMVKQQSGTSQNGPLKYFEDQFDDEEVLYVFRKHPIVMRKGLIIGLSAWLIGPVYTLALTYLRPNNYPSIAFFFGSLVLSIILGILLLVPSWISWYFSVFIVSDQRLIQITQKGMFSRSVVDMGLNQIQMVNYEVAGLQETLLGYGTITMQTFVGDLVIHDLHHPGHIQKKILQILRDHGVPATSFASTGSDTDDPQDNEVLESE
jgi:hypothetical protein